RPHKALALMTPVEYILKENKNCNMWWTHTLLLTTSGEVVSFLFRITKKEIYMTKEEFVSYIFDKTVEMYAATYGSCNPLNKPEGKDDFDKIYRFLEDRYIKRLEDAGIKSPVKSPLS
ncbi:hypothetical protein, partial [Escherichia coli]|uniref:hypothetical protein n=1 Tax=Escherichia coli TaxID=562 RepID=UPI001F1A7B54